MLSPVKICLNDFDLIDFKEYSTVSPLLAYKQAVAIGNRDRRFKPLTFSMKEVKVCHATELLELRGRSRRKGHLSSVARGVISTMENEYSAGKAFPSVSWNIEFIRKSI